MMRLYSESSTLGHHVRQRLSPGEMINVNRKLALGQPF